MSHFSGQRFRGNGKLLLSGEYLVLDGATALSIPTRYGQELTIQPTSTDWLQWNSIDHQGQKWFSARFSPDCSIMSTSDETTALYLQKVLKEARKLAPSSPTLRGILVETKLEFPRNWGLGSSSTLTHLVAKWFNVPAFALHDRTSKGSGYDIASAENNVPILYTNGTPRTVTTLPHFNPPFEENLFFVHLNQKQTSTTEVARYSELKKEIDLETCTKEVSKLTQRMVEARELSVFEEVMKEHEYYLSNILQRDTVGDTYFKDYDLGTMKSLGAWGGDFILATGNKDTPRYFKHKGYETVLPYSKMILNA